MTASKKQFSFANNRFYFTLNNMDILFDYFFRLAFFELNYHFCTTQQLQSAVLRHYSKQVGINKFQYFSKLTFSKRYCVLWFYENQ